MELLREILPAAKKFALLFNQTSVANVDAITKSYPDRAGSLGLRVQIYNVTTERDLIGAFDEVAQSGADGLVVAPDPFFNSTACAVRLRLLPNSIECQRFFNPAKLWWTADC
jgi:hypothetical protein